MSTRIASGKKKYKVAFASEKIKLQSSINEKWY